VSEKEPYIAASPDGIIDNSTILEIKCPTRPLKELINSGKYDVFMEAGKPCDLPLKPTHVYNIYRLFICLSFYLFIGNVHK
jgi:hypothetical protein